MKQKISIIGHGQIGTALHKVYNDFSDKFEVKVIDTSLGFNEDIRNTNILNICIPYNEKFVDNVNEYVLMSKPKLVVIHSTVKPGTTKRIIGNVCYSPVRGVHPHLYEGIKTFVKFIGAENTEHAQKYADHLRELGIMSKTCKDSKTVEFAKIIDTTYYGICIAFHNDVKKLLDKEEIDWDIAMRYYNDTYNYGYKSLGKENVIRPVLYPDTKIGGHCIIPNAKLLKEFMDTDLVNSVLRYE